MSRPAWSSRIAAWLAVCALLLKAAVPMLATASAEAQGKALAEVCTVYGVSWVALDDTTGGGEPAAPAHGAPHAGDHCALAGLLALAAPGATAVAPVLPAGAPAAAAPRATPAPAHDRSAHWAARLKHGPPAIA
jgi:hypothetical protein